MSGQEFSVEVKRIYFRVIAFMESEKNGAKIPLNNTKERSQVCLGLSRASITNLKKEMRELEEQEQQQQQQEQKEKTEEENKYGQARRTRSATAQSLSASSASNITTTTASRTTSPSASNRKSHRKRELSASDAKSLIPTPEPLPPKKKGTVGRKPVILSCFAEDTIRYVFHQMLSEKIYPSTATLLARLQAEHPDFPIQTESTLLKNMKRLGFKYRATSKVSVALE